MENKMNLWQIRTDLAYDKANEYKSKDVIGLIETKENFDNIEVIKHQVREKASSIINKKPGLYYNHEEVTTNQQLLDIVKENVLKLINEDSNREGFNIISEIEYKGYWEDCSEKTDCDCIKEYITEYKQLRGIFNFYCRYDRKDDLVLIYRKK